MVDLPHKEAAETTPRTNTVGTFILTKSQTLLRLKHANNKATKMTAMMTRALKIRRALSFDMSSKIAQDFLSWLTGSGGGCKSDRQAHKIVSRCLKFLKFCCEEDEDLTFEIVDFSLCSSNLLFKFVDMMQDECNLRHAGHIGYLDGIAEMGDFRKVNGT